jgi:uncharacterized protein YegL
MAEDTIIREDEVFEDTVDAGLESAVEFADNPEPRCACVLLLDTSRSMKGARITALNEGLRTFRDELNKDVLAKKRVEVAIVTFDSHVNVIQDFVTAEEFNPPTLTAQGLTHIGAAIDQALDMLERRKAQYRSNGIVYYRPWVFMLTDGEPQGEPDDVVDAASQRLKAEEAGKHLAFFAVGVENANIARLGEIVVRTPVKLKGLNFVDMFIWLSASMQRVSHSKVDEQIALPPPGWGTV